MRGRHRAGPADGDTPAVNCHHNFVSKEGHFGKDVRLIRQATARARKGDHGSLES